jgi:hypothetical protein
MFKSRRRTYRKSRPSVPLLVILLAIPLALILLELLAWLLVGITGNSANLAAYEGQPPIVTAYSLKFVSQTKQPYDGSSNRGHLAAQRHLAMGYTLVGNQNSEFWRINEQGFRDNDPVPLEKPNNEIRIFLLGGSTAFGQWNPNNQATVASWLEARLNERIAQQKRSPEKYRPVPLPVYKPEREKALTLPPQLREGQYRVINAAVPGYASGNELAELVFQILPYNPDAILVLDGYTDLMLPSSQWATDIPHEEAFLDNALAHLSTHITGQLKQAIADTSLVKSINYWFLKPKPSASQRSLVVTEQAGSLEQHLAGDSTELKRRVIRYGDRIGQMVRLTSGAQIPLLVALQPEVTGRPNDKLSPKERDVLNELGPIYKQRVQAGYVELTQVMQKLQEAFPNNVKTLNFYKLDQDLPQETFYDAIHLTEEGNKVLAEQFYRTLTNLQKLQVTPPKPPK